MVVELVRKEFVKTRAKRSGSVFARLFKAFFALLFLSAFVAILCFTALSLDRKIVEYSPYGSFDFLLLYQFAALGVTILSLLVPGRKILFDEEDFRLVSPLPIGKDTIVLSKAVFLYIQAVLALLLLATPSLICYGVGRVQYAYFYVFAFLYPFLLGFFATGAALLLCPLVELFYRLIRFSDLLQFVLATLLVLGLCFAYEFVLRLFLTALSDSSVGGIFSEGFVDALHRIAANLYPVVHILTPAIESSRNALPNVFFFLGENLLLLILGFFCASYFYGLLHNRSFLFRLEKKRAKEARVVSPTKALIKKEFAMLFKDDSYAFSYTSLLILAPFLSYLVISSLNGIIFTNLEFFSVYFPELVNGLNVALILLFLTVINSSAALSMSREGKMLQIVKYLPISPIRQILVKLLTPMALSSLSLLATAIALLAGGVIEPTVFWISLLLGALILFADNVLSMEWDMHDKGEGKVKFASLNLSLSLGFPVLILVVHFALSFSYAPAWVIYLVEALLGLSLLFPALFRIKKRYLAAFYGMEVS